MLQGFTNKYFNILFQEMCIPQYVKTKRQKKKKPNTNRIDRNIDRITYFLKITQNIQ